MRKPSPKLYLFLSLLNRSVKYLRTASSVVHFSMANTQGNEIEQTAVNTQLPPAARTKPDQDFIHHEPPYAVNLTPHQCRFLLTAPSMRYELPKQPVPEAGPVLVTPLERVPGARAVNVDCPYCRKVVKTEVREVDADDDGYVCAAYFSKLKVSLICI